MSGGRVLHGEDGIEAWIEETNRRLGALERSAQLIQAAVGAGGIVFKDGGAATFLDPNDNPLVTINEMGLVILEDDGSQLMVLDGGKLRFNRSNGTRILEITPGGGLKIYASNGTTELVVLDGSGLAIDGVVQPALEQLTSSDSNNHTPTTTTTTTCSISFAIPSWANEVTLMTFARAQGSNNTGGNRGQTNLLENDVNGTPAVTDDFISLPNTETRTSFVALTTTRTSFSSPIVCRQRLTSSGGSLTSGEQRLEGFAVIRRT